jgi:copper oxidase (laccase) domain-containing protein
VDVRHRRIAAVHAGWRGSLERISEKAVAAMARAGSEPADLTAWMGPAISRESYEVGGELAERFRAAFPMCEGIVFDNRLDLVLLNAYQLRAAGVPPPQIHAANCCTARNLDFCCSYRAEGDCAGRMVMYSMIVTKANDEL